MKPSDTHIERMAETFAERTPFLRKSLGERVAVWKDALEIGREQGLLDQIERNMAKKKLVDLPVQDVWDRAREY